MIEGGRIVFSDSMEAFNNYVQPQSMLVRLENMPEESSLMQIAGITKVQFLSDKQCRLYFDHNNDVSELVVAASLQYHWRLKEINYERSLLDDVFKQLSTQSQK
jgi:ABC-2 type transport system ATP-binding protein